MKCLLLLSFLIVVINSYAQKDTLQTVPYGYDNPFEYQFPKEIDMERGIITFPDSICKSFSGKVFIEVRYSIETCQIQKVKIGYFSLVNNLNDTICNYKCFTDTCLYTPCVKKYQSFFENCMRKTVISTKSTDMELRKRYDYFIIRLCINSDDN